ncbi:hypothetical protein J6590_030878 [Homalodisca vitripennis]|nr:hypothetical protein J6590_030878 [Homalodisca vitripennis]
MELNEEERIAALLLSVEREERQRNVELQQNLSIVRRQLFQDVQDDVIIRNDDEEVDVLHESEHDTDSEESVSSFSETTRQILPSSPLPPRGKAIGLLRGAVSGIPGRGLGVFRRPAGSSAEGAAGPSGKGAPGPSPVGAASLSAEGAAGPSAERAPGPSPVGAAGLSAEVAAGPSVEGAPGPSPAGAAGLSAEVAAGPSVERAPSPSPVGSAGLSAEGAAGRGRSSAIGQLRGASANQRWRGGLQQGGVPAYRGRRIATPEYTADGKKYLGKDSITIWDKDLSEIRRAPQGRARLHNIVVRLPGPKGDARNIRSPSDAFALFLPDQELEKIVLNTNKWIQTAQENYEREREPYLQLLPNLNLC